MSLSRSLVPWELGSDFHFGCLDSASSIRHPWEPSYVLGASGRDVLSLLLSSKRAEFGWNRLWLPSYLCAEVAQSVPSTLEVEVYPDVPAVGAAIDVNKLTLKAGDILLVVNQWGVRARPDLSSLRDRGVTLVEDHTHDPWSTWSEESDADYCLASLRKTLPISDGGVLWSPQEHRLPAQPLTSEEGLQASSNKLAGMLLKSRYLDGTYHDKDRYRELLEIGESQVGDGSPSGATPLARELIRSLNALDWRKKRAENLAYLIPKLEPSSPFSVLSLADVPEGQVPLGCILIASNHPQREELRRYLIQRRVYPAVLWPIAHGENHSRMAERDLSQRMLFLHVDGRYEAADMSRLARILGEFSDLAE